MQPARDHLTIMRPVENSHIQRQQGFTLLEVLIALLILSIGLLGLAALQTTSLRSNQMASMRTTATQMAYDISDRMRANPAGVAAGEYLLAGGATPPTGTSIAATDLIAWHQAVTGASVTPGALPGLPGGRTSITQCDGTSVPPCDGVTHVITVQWDEMRTGATGTTCPPTQEDHLRCYRLIFSE
ncbi:MAG: type IV pilus modification protein PilV [Pseudomonadota bacterium]